MGDDVVLQEQDISARLLESAINTGAVGIDVETSGLRWDESDLLLVQVAVGLNVEIVRFRSDTTPERLIRLLEHREIRKVFHHALFDLRFLLSNLDVHPSSVCCTKIAARISDPGLPNREYSLQRLLARRLSISISKAMQKSDWSARSLSAEQLEYAAADARYLVPLRDELQVMAFSQQVAEDLQSIEQALPSIARQQVRGVGDLFAH